MRPGEIEIAVPFKDHESMFEEAYMGASTDGWAKKWIRGIP